MIYSNNNIKYIMIRRKYKFNNKHPNIYLDRLIN